MGDQQPVDEKPVRTWSRAPALEAWAGAFGAIVIVCTLLIVLRYQVQQSFAIRDLYAICVGIAVVGLANHSLIARGKTTAMGNVIAFDAVVFTIAGLVAAVCVCSRWPLAILVSGASLLVGGFFGLLFGYPQRVAQKRDLAKVSEGTPPSTPNTPADTGASGGNQSSTPDAAPERGTQNLVAESAATLGKVIAGFGLAKFHDARDGFIALSKGIGPALNVATQTAKQTDASSPFVMVAGSIMIYFFATGFLAGIFLPSYFLGDFFNPTGAGAGQPTKKQ
jgi:hypothetical protein